MFISMVQIFSDIGHRKFNLGVRHIGFQNSRRRQPEIGYVFGSQSTRNVILAAKQTLCMGIKIFTVSEIVAENS